MLAVRIGPEPGTLLGLRLRSRAWALRTDRLAKDTARQPDPLSTLPVANRAWPVVICLSIDCLVRLLR